MPPDNEDARRREIDGLRKAIIRALDRRDEALRLLGEIDDSINYMRNKLAALGSTDA